MYHHDPSPAYDNTHHHNGGGGYEHLTVRWDVFVAYSCFFFFTAYLFFSPCDVKQVPRTRYGQMHLTLHLESRKRDHVLYITFYCNLRVRREPAIGGKAGSRGS